MLPYAKELVDSSKDAYDVLTAASITEARELAGQWNFNLLISDIGLPDGSGYDLMAEMLREGFICGIAVTGYGMDHDLERSRHAGLSRISPNRSGCSRSKMRCTKRRSWWQKIR